jgi:GDP-L-fucose synthase
VTRILYNLSPAVAAVCHCILHGAYLVEIWGTGTRREFLHVDDLADACLYLMQRYEDDERLICVGSGTDLCVAGLAGMVAKTVGFAGRLRFDTSKPDSAPRKLLDVSRPGALGCAPSVSLETGIASTYQWYLEGLGGVRN